MAEIKALSVREWIQLLGKLDPDEKLTLQDAQHSYHVHVFAGNRFLIEQAGYDHRENCGLFMTASPDEARQPH